MNAQRRFIVAWLVVFLLVVGLRAAMAQEFREDFDPHFRESALKFLHGLLPGDDWRWWKAQCIQESWLRPEVESPAGAVGVCQLMPDSASDAGLEPRLRVHPRLNIRAGAFLFRRDYLTWWPRPTRFDRMQLAWASYNAGGGNIIDAQKLCDDAVLWEGISPCLFHVTGHHSEETIGYVEKIPKWYRHLTEEENHEALE